MLLSCKKENQKILCRIFAGPSMLNLFLTHIASRTSGANYLWQDGDFEGLVVVFTHQIEGDDWEDVPRRRAGLPTHQLLSEPESSRKLLSLRKKTK